MTVIYGHRGAKGELPENTLASFEQCLKQGVFRQLAFGSAMSINNGHCGSSLSVAAPG